MITTHDGRCWWFPTGMNQPCGASAEYELICEHGTVPTCADCARRVENDLRRGTLEHMGEPVVDGHVRLVSIAVRS